MKYHVLLLALLLCLAPLTPTLAGLTEVHVSYLNHGQFEYKRKTYDYTDQVAAIRADYADDSIDLVVVDIGNVASQLDKAQVCQLKLSLLARVKMQLKTDDSEQDIFCN